MTPPNIDYGKAATLMGVVEKITTVAPRCTNLLGAAMDELNAMEAVAKEYHDAKAKEEKRAKEAEQAAKVAEAKKVAEQEAPPKPKVIPSVPDVDPATKWPDPAPPPPTIDTASPAIIDRRV